MKFNKIFTLIFLGILIITPRMFCASNPKLNNQQSDQKVNIVVTTKQVASILKLVTNKTKVNIDILNNSNLCPHHYQMSFEDKNKIINADYLIFINEKFDFKQRNILKEVDQNKIIRISDFEEIKFIKNNGKINWHFWMSINNMNILSKKLHDIFNKNNQNIINNITKEYNASLFAFLNNLRQDIANRMKDKKFVIMSDSLQYLFEDLKDKTQIYEYYNIDDNLNQYMQIENLYKENDITCTFIDSADKKKIDFASKFSKICKINSEKWESPKLLRTKDDQPLNINTNVGYFIIMGNILLHLIGDDLT